MIIDMKDISLFKYLLFCFFLSSSTSTVIWSQDSHRIQIDIKNYESDQLVVGYYYGDKTLILDTLVALSSGAFILEGNEPLHSGVYLALTLPGQEYFQFMVNNKDQQFEMQTDALDLGNVKIEGSADNETFYHYLQYLKGKRAEVEEVNAQFAQQDPSSEAAKKKALKLLDDEVKAFQKEIIDEHPQYITSLLLKGNTTPEIPEFEGTEEEIKAKNFKYYKDHYFDYLEFGNSASLYTPFFFQKIDDYLNKLTIQTPDSIVISLDHVLEKLSANEENFRFFLSHYLNHYAQSKVVGFDAVYVHLSENYYGQGKAPWVDEENLQKIVSNASRLKPTLIGKQAPDFTVYKEDNTPVNLYELDSKYTLLLFWAPDCGHCTKAMPEIKKFYEKYKDSGLTLIAICNKTGDKFETCWDGVREKGIEDFINVGDKTQRSRILAKYYVRNTPKIFILDENKKIVMKNIGSEQLDEVMQQLLQLEDEKKKSVGAVH